MKTDFCKRLIETHPLHLKLKTFFITLLNGTDPFLTLSAFHMFQQTLSLHHFVMKDKYFEQIEISTVRRAQKRQTMVELNRGNC